MAEDNAIKNAWLAEKALVELGQQLDACAEALSNARNDLHNVEKREKDVLSMLKHEVSRGTKISDVAAERAARITNEWSSFIDGLIAAKQQEVHAKIMWDKLNIKIDIYRTLLSYNKSQMKVL